jgi:hypothetical protein
VTDFKEGDRVKVRKLSEDEFEKIYISRINLNYQYYLEQYPKNFNKTYTVHSIYNNNYVYLSEVKECGFYPEELEKVSTFKLRLQLAKELIK